MSIWEQFKSVHFTPEINLISLIGDFYLVSSPNYYTKYRALGLQLLNVPSVLYAECCQTHCWGAALVALGNNGSIIPKRPAIYCCHRTREISRSKNCFKISQMENKALGTEARPFPGGQITARIWPPAIPSAHPGAAMGAACLQPPLRGQKSAICKKAS